ncbi:MAG TPA: acyl-CoA dehydrogenase [Solirubrobacteraceae bacterium]|nr:acyl-CoA dehydrogenase [Solirubrobacteraceae bacterium]
MAAVIPESRTFDPPALLRLLDGRYGPVREEIRTVMRQPEFAPVLALPTAEYRERVLVWAKALAAEGLTAPGFPERYGGRGDPGANVAGFETVALGDLSLLVKFGVQFGLWGGAVQQLGTERHHERYLRATASLELAGCFAMTEAAHGSDVQQLGTTATYDPDSDEFVVHTPDDEAHKEYIGNAACHGRVAAVFAQLLVGGENHGVHCVVVELRDKDGTVRDGIRIEDCGEKMGLNGVDNGRIWFDQVRVPREALLNRYGDVNADGVYSSPIESAGHRFFTMLGTLVQGRVCIAGASVSAAKSALTIAVRYGLRRRQFGPEPGHEVPILDYRTHQRRLMPPLAKTYALHFAQAKLVDRFDAVMRDDEAPERERRELESLTAGMKATASWHAAHTIQTCRECCGGAGYMSVNRFAGLRADTDIFTTFEGDNTILMLLLAKGLLTDFAEHFGELNPVGTVQFVAGQAMETVVERLFARQIVQLIGDFVSRSGDDDDDLLAPADQLDLFRWREGHITASAAQRFKRGLEDGHEPFEVFRAVQDHAVNAARAHMATVLLQAFQGAVEECADESLTPVLKLLCDLYALSELETDRAFFMEHGRLSGPRCKAITREVNRLCNEARLCADGLVDAFGIPDEVLAAPIGLKDAGEED